jgi:signal transduction histidine kinase
VAHAARVAVTATVIIGAIYVCVVVGFNAVDRHRLLAQVDARLAQRLDQAARHPSAAGSIANTDNDQDVDDAPVFLWSVSRSGGETVLTPGAPGLQWSEWSPSTRLLGSRLGPEHFRLQSKQIGSRWIVVGQSLANEDRVASDLVALEVIAGPLLLLAVFFGTLLIGLKAAGPVEVARRRQLEFTADASHELRTPLSVIEAEVSLALSDDRSRAEYRATLERVNAECIRLRDVVGDLLWLSRFDSEPPPPGDEPVDVSAIAAACSDRFEAVAQRGGIDLSVMEREDDRPWINAPPEWIDRLTAVLVDNACRYAGPGGAVQIAITVIGNRVRLTVDDSGPGIAPEERSKLFDRFHRATTEGNGAGLGLAIADAVVQATRGEWQVGRADLGGAHMEVSWPRSSSTRDQGERRKPSGTPVVGGHPVDASAAG